MKRLITILLPILGMIESANANGKVLNTPPHRDRSTSH